MGGVKGKYDRLKKTLLKFFGMLFRFLFVMFIFKKREDYPLLNNISPALLWVNCVGMKGGSIDMCRRTSVACR